LAPTGANPLFLPTDEIASNNVRILATIPHPKMKISIFQWNEKWIIEVEGGAYKQTFRIAQESVPGLDDVKRMVTPQLLDGCMDRFNTMHRDFTAAYQLVKPQNS
jgi:hypothetical protein